MGEQHKQWYTLTFPKFKNISSITSLDGITLLHGEEQFVSADAGYQGAPQREELAEVDVDWLIAERPGKVRTLKQHPRKNKTAINIEYMKASIRAKVEHPFRIIKRQFGFVKARYKGLLKNDNQLMYRTLSGKRINNTV